MASLRKAKKEAKKLGKVFVDPTKERKQLVRQLKEQVYETNKRLRRLNNKGYYGTFSSRKLFDRLGGKVNALIKDTSGKVKGIKLNNKMSMTDLTAVNKATKQFLESATSSTTRLAKVVRDTKDSMYKTLKIKDDNLTMEDIENYYNMLGDNDFDYFNDKIGASSMWALIDDSIEANDNKNGFLNRLSKYINLNDEDARSKAINLFNKYV